MKLLINAMLILVAMKLGLAITQIQIQIQILEEIIQTIIKPVYQNVVENQNVLMSEGRTNAFASLVLSMKLLINAMRILHRLRRLVILNAEVSQGALML